jgi:protein-S-isoprenylcysteine O-methyltransferase Ste14
MVMRVTRSSSAVCWVNTYPRLASASRGGFNRYVRNPVYLGSLLIFSGEALVFGRLSLLVYAAIGWAGAAGFVRWYEEPALTRRFGAEYEAYRRAVPAWRPRLHPWTPGDREASR